MMFGHWSCSRRTFLQASLGLAGTGLLAGSGFQSEALTMVYFENFPPFSWVHGQEPIKGILIDIMDEAARRAQTPIHHLGLPWARAQNMVRSGHADGFCTTITRERLSYARASQTAVFQTAMTLVGRRGDSRIEQMKAIRDTEELASWHVGHYLGSGWASERLTHHKISWTRNIEQSLRMVAQGRVDLAIDVETVLRYHLQELKLSEQLTLLQPLDQVHFHLFFGLASPWAEQMSRFDATLLSMHEEGVIKRIHDAWMNA
jgi:polar amino acid transport system substrate-binding protein